MKAYAGCRRGSPPPQTPTAEGVDEVSDHAPPNAAVFRLRPEPSALRGLADRYDYGQSDDDALAAGVRIRNGARTRSDLDAIYEWKTGGRGRTRLLKNTDAEIADALDAACHSATDRTALAALCGLEGVLFPVATAVLTMVFPARFTVIDFRALEALGHGRDTALNMAFVLAYLEACRALSAAHSMSLREFDKALWQWSKEQPA